MKPINGSNTDLQGEDGEQVSVTVSSQGTAYQTSYTLMDMKGTVLQQGAFAAGTPLRFTLSKTVSPVLLGIVGVFTGPGSWYDIDLSSPNTDPTIHYRNAKPPNASTNGVAFTIDVV